MSFDIKHRMSSVAYLSFPSGIVFKGMGSKF